MKLTTAATFGSTFILIATLSGCKGSQTPDATAQPDPTVATAPAATPAAAPAGPTETASTAIPDSVDGIWQAIDQKSTELKASIASGSLADVHHQAFAIRDLVAALPTHSPALSAEEQAKLEGEVKFVATLADRLDQTGDAGDKAGTQANYDKLVAVLNGITRNK